MDIKDIAYEAYKNEWKASHITEQIFLETSRKYLSHCEDTIREYGVEVATDFESYLMDYYGYSSQEMYCTKGEFLANEYRDKEYITNVLFKNNPVLKELYLNDLKKFWETTKINSPNEMREIIEDCWRLMEDVPFEEGEDHELYIAQDYNFSDYHHTAPYEHTFTKGTSREDIWHWFDENHPIGIYYLLYHFSEDGGFDTIYEDLKVRIRGTYEDCKYAATVENMTERTIKFLIPGCEGGSEWDIDPQSYIYLLRKGDILSLLNEGAFEVKG